MGVREMNEMNEINDEIKQTLNLMQTDITEGARDELQCHIVCLLDIKRKELLRRLTKHSRSETVTHDQAPHKSVKLDGQLTADELRAGGWWCAETSEDTLKAFSLFGLKDGEYTPWDGSFYGCFLFENGSNLVDRGFRHHTEGLKEIHRIGSEFYWS